MDIEYEVAYQNANHDNLREKIIQLWWVCSQEKTLMKRIIFKDPLHPKKWYFRVRDEWNRITCTYKQIKNWELNAHSVLEAETEVSSYENMKTILQQTWITQKSYQESYRETWKIWANIEFMLDEWPGIKPFVELEWKNEETIKEYSKKLWFNYRDWIFWGVDQIYNRQLWIPCDIINNLTEITFKHPPKF